MFVITIALSVAMELINQLIHLVCWEVHWVQSEVPELEGRECMTVCVWRGRGCEGVRV